MLKQTLLIAFSLLLSVSFATGQDDSPDRQVGDFSRLHIFGAVVVELEKGDAPLVSIVHAEGITPDQLTTEVKGDVLHIRSRISLSSQNKVFLLVRYTTTPVEVVAVKGAEINCKDTIQATNLSFDLKSGAKADFKANTTNIEGRVGSGALLTLSGKTERTAFSASSRSVIEASNLLSEEAVADAKTRGIIKLHASKRLKASATSGGFIHYLGNPEDTDFQEKLSGEILKMDQ